MSIDSTKTHPDLDKRFLKPEGWRWHMFSGSGGHRLRFGSVFPKDDFKAIVVILPGLSEFGEKYFEICRDLLAMGYACWILDWQGQGRSHRHLPKSPHKRISSGFERDMRDLHIFMEEYVKKSSINPRVGRMPLIMLGHSMGGNIGLRYIHKYIGDFDAAAFTSPLLEIKAFHLIPYQLRVPLTRFLYEIGDCSYVPGGGDYSPSMREGKAAKLFSKDTERCQIHAKWYKFDPNLQVGNVTWRWLYHATKSCHFLNKKKFLTEINIPVLLASASQDHLVSNTAISRAHRLLPNSQYLQLAPSRHEILMEKDGVRDQFLRSFDEFVKSNILSKHK